MVCNECNKSTAGVCVEHSSVMFKATQSFFTDAPGENAGAEGYPPVETERTAVSEVGRLRRLYEQTRDQRIRQAKEIDALKSRAEAAEARVRELERLLKAMTELASENDDDAGKAQDERDTARAEAARLREAVKSLVEALENALAAYRAAHESAMRKVREDVRAARAEALEEAAKVPLNPEIVGRTEMARAIRAISSEAPAARGGREP